MLVLCLKSPTSAGGFVCSVLSLKMCVDMLINFPECIGRCCVWSTLYGRNPAIPMIPYCKPCHALKGSVSNIAMHACALQFALLLLLCQISGAPVNRLRVDSERLHQIRCCLVMPRYACCRHLACGHQSCHKLPVSHSLSCQHKYPQWRTSMHWIALALPYTLLLYAMARQALTIYTLTPALQLAWLPCLCYETRHLFPSTTLVPAQSHPPHSLQQ